MTRVLVIDDDNEIRELLVEILVAEGFECSSASNGSEGLRLALSEAPKLIIMDMMMPVMSGHEVVAELMRHPTLSTTPLILMSASEWELQSAGDSGGYVRQLHKPFGLQQFLTLVAQMLR